MQTVGTITITSADRFIVISLSGGRVVLCEPEINTTEKLNVALTRIASRIDRGWTDAKPVRDDYEAEPCPPFLPRWGLTHSVRQNRPTRAQVRASRHDRRMNKRKSYVQAMRPRAPKVRQRPTRSHTIRVPRMIREIRQAAHRTSWIWE